MRLSVLDQSIAVAGRPHGQSIRNTVSLAQHCEALGYDRFWVSEHHNHPTIVGTAPEIVMAVSLLVVFTQLALVPFSLIHLGTTAQVIGQVTFSLSYVVVIIRGRLFSIGNQVGEPIRVHDGVTRANVIGLCRARAQGV